MRIFTTVVTLGLYLSTSMIAGAQSIGPTSGLEVPRFVSLKSKRINLRVGPGKKYSVLWRYVNSGLPVEIIQEFDQWRRIRDSEGSEGWVFQSLLSGRRTAIVSPWIKDVDPQNTEEFAKAYKSRSVSASVVAKIQPGAVIKVESCNKNWCEISTGGVSGFLQKSQLWGVYPAEEIKG